MQEMHGLLGLSHESLLTARQVQRMLGVDRSTIYRMAQDGRLPSIRVGRQLRFPADQIAQLMEAGPAKREPEGTELAAGVLTVAAELLGVSLVLTDMAGQPLTPIMNPPQWLLESADRPDVLPECFAEWGGLAQDRDLTPQWRTGPLGFDCARAFTREGSSLTGMVVAGGVAPEGAERPLLHQLSEAERGRVLAALPIVAAAIAHPDEGRRLVLNQKENQ